MYTPDTIRLFTQRIPILRFPVSMHRTHKILALCENCNLTDIFDNLNFNKVDIRAYCNPRFKIGGKEVYSNKEKIALMKKRSMASFSFIKQVDAAKRNSIIDLTEYGQEIRRRLKNSFNSPLSSMFFSSGLSIFGQDKSFYNTLLYIIDVRKPFEVALNRRLSWIPIFHNLKHKENIPYMDTMILCVIKSDSSPVFIKIFDKNEKIEPTRALSILNAIKVTNDNLEEFGEEIAKSVNVKEEEATNISTVAKNKELLRVSGDKAKETIKSAISNLVENHPNEANTIIEDLNDPDTTIEKEIKKKSIMLAAIKYKLTKDKQAFDDSIKVANLIIHAKSTKEELKVAKEKVELELSRYVERSTTDFKVPSITTNPLTKELDIQKVLNRKIPNTIIENKQASFNLQLFNDLTKMLKTFSLKEYPLKLTNYAIDSKYDTSDIKASKFVTFKFTMIDETGKEYKNEILLPHIDNQGTMKINGLDKTMVGQLMLKPVYFPEPHLCKISTFFSTIQLQYREIRDKAYTIAYITGMVVPMYLVYALLYKNGLDDLFSKLGFSRKDLIVTRDPTETKKAKKDNAKWFIQFDNNEYLFFPPSILESNPIARTFFHSMKLINYTARHITVDQFLDNDYQTDILILNTGKKNAGYYLRSFFNGFLDPISSEIIEEQGYPTKLSDLLWKCTELIHTQKVDRRTDLTMQRYRTSETLLHIIYKQLLMAYNVYQTKKMMGYNNPEFEIKPDYVFKELVNTQLIRSNENINPIEELSASTRMTYVGVGGVVNKDGVPERMRVVDETYFGTIDPIDTPEGGSNIGLLQHATVDALLKDTRGTFDIKKMSNEEKSGISSVSSVMTPFSNHDDGARSMMAANQIRQALPLMHKEIPLVQTGYETALATFLSNSFIKKCSFDGIVKEVSNSQIIIESTEPKSKGTRQIIDLEPSKLNSGMTMHSVSYFEPKVQVGDKVKKYQLLAEGSSIKDGTVSLGTNLLVAFMPYAGANHDDSIVISSKLAKHVSSRHIEEIQINLLPNSKVIVAPGVAENNVNLDIAKKLLTIGEGIEYKQGDTIFSYIPDNLAKFIELNPSERIYGGGVIKHKADKDGKIVDIKIFANDDIAKYPKLKSLYMISREKHGTTNDSNYKVKGEKFEGILITLTFEYIESGINCGDKYANRHGNKGVIALVEENMPVTPWGETIDIIFNPLGVVGRMNPGQIFELYLGLIGWKVRQDILTNPSQKNTISIIKKVYYDILDKSTDKMISKTILSVLTKMTTNSFEKYIEHLKTLKGFSWIFPTYATPKLADIQKALKVLNLKDKYTLDIPRYGKGIKTKFEVPVGYLYLYKMEHVGSHKISSRGVGAYESRGRQPMVSSNAKGGQRVGEFDSWSLFSHGATNIIKEMFGPLSDDYISKNELIANIIDSGFTHHATEIKVTPTRDILEVYFRMMLLDFNNEAK